MRRLFARRAADESPTASDVRAEVARQRAMGRDAVVCSHPRACAGMAALAELVGEQLQAARAALAATGRYTTARASVGTVAERITELDEGHLAQIRTLQAEVARLRACLPVDVDRMRDTVLRYEDELAGLRAAREHCEWQHRRRPAAGQPGMVGIDPGPGCRPAAQGPLRLGHGGEVTGG